MNHTNTIWLSAAETSADIHGARLVQALKKIAPDLHLVGMGGSEMQKAGLLTLHRAEELSAMGLTEILYILPKVLLLYSKLWKELKAIRPKCVILLDAPDFHFPLARICKSLSIPVYYYISPQVWAWRKGRIKFLKKNVHKLFCILPFEQPFFLQHGLKAEYVGHPLLEQFDFPAINTTAQKQKKIALLPGSRTKEVSKLLPIFAQAALKIKTKAPDYDFLVIKAANIPQQMLRNFWTVDCPMEIAPFEDRYAKLNTCCLAIVASGTASLECALLGLPTIVTYKVSWLSYLMAKKLIKIPYISIPNLILDKEVFPELIQDQATPQSLEHLVTSWIQRPVLMENIKSELTKIRFQLGSRHASLSTAKAILQDLSKQDSS